MRPVLFRLLLCVTLLLNGIGSGVASVHVGMMGLAPQAGLVDQVDPAAGHCPHADADAHDGRVPADAEGSACMKLCADICLQHCNVLPTMRMAEALPPIQLAPARSLVAGPPSIQPSPLLRPPITA